MQVKIAGLTMYVLMGLYGAIARLTATRASRLGCKHGFNGFEQLGTRYERERSDDAGFRIARDLDARVAAGEDR